MSKLILVRGLPGSGKSTLAKQLGALHVEADMYFESNDGYIFDPNDIPKAHTWCFETVSSHLPYTDVVVSNTFTQLWEMQKYIYLALGNGHDFVVVCMTNDYGNIHGVPEETLQRMKDRWEPYKGEIVCSDSEELKNLKNSLRQND